MSSSQTPRQTWAQQRIGEVYANDAHPYFAREDHRKGRLNAAMLRLNQETAPPNRSMPGQQVISATSLMGDDAFVKAEDAADYLSKAAGNGAAPKAPGALDQGGRSDAASNIQQNPLHLAQINQQQNPPSLQSQVPPTPRPKPPVPHYLKPPMIHNPTGGMERNNNAGKGWHGAPRKGRTHKGTDILAYVGDPVVSPIEGKVVKRLPVYTEKKTKTEPWLKAFRSVHIKGTGKHKGMLVKLYYVDGRGPGISEHVKAGTTILGLLQNVGKDHHEPKMKPHVHMRVEWNGVEIDPATVLPLWQTQKPSP